MVVDGQVDPLEATKTAYDVIKLHDPHHPVSLCLNCENYYFEEYTAGADIILSDVYPIGTNTTWSSKYQYVYLLPPFPPPYPPLMRHLHSLLLLCLHFHLHH